MVSSPATWDVYFPARISVIANPKKIEKLKTWKMWRKHHLYISIPSWKILETLSIFWWGLYANCLLSHDSNRWILVGYSNQVLAGHISYGHYQLTNDASQHPGKVLNPHNSLAILREKVRLDKYVLMVNIYFRWVFHSISILLTKSMSISNYCSVWPFKLPMF